MREANSPFGHVCKFLKLFCCLLVLLLVVPVVSKAKGEKDLLKAIKEKQIEAAKKALAKGADLNDLDKKTGVAILAVAANNCDTQMLRVLIEHSQPNSKSIEQALIAAEHCNSCDENGAIQVLLRGTNSPLTKAKKGQCWNVWKNDLGPKLINSVRRGDVEGVRSLAANPASLAYQERIRIRPESTNGYSNSQGNSSMSISVWAAAQFSDEGPTALYYAVKARNAEIVKLLIESGADTSVKFHELDSGNRMTDIREICDKLGYADIRSLIK
jgi:ankyrin repeat protein